MDAFDADVLIYAAVQGHPLGRRVRALFPSNPVVGRPGLSGVGSVLLLPEVLSRPMRNRATGQIALLVALLGRLELRSVDARTAQLATTLGAAHELRAADAVHLATAVIAGADRFITNSRKDFAESITEIAVTYPERLDDPDDG